MTPEIPAEVYGRPCPYCVAFYTDGGKRPTILPTERDCEWEHRDDQRVYDLARAMAKVMQDRHPSDQQIQWFLADADQVVDHFDPTPERWRVRRLPVSANDGPDGIEMRLRINDVTYVGLEGGKDDRGPLLPLSEYRRQLTEADRG